MENSPEKYNQEWFKERAFKSLRKLDNGIWDYSDSLLIYVSSGAEIYESLQEVDTDISDRFLGVAESHAASQGIEVRRMKSSFEELPELLGTPTVPRFVSIGLTFSNYAPQDILNLLRGIAGQNGYAFINAQMRDRVDMVQLQKVYQNDAEHIADDKLRLIGLDPVADITPRLADDGFRVSCFVLRTNKLLEDMGVKTGDKLIVFQSLRYTKGSLEAELRNFDHRSFDRGSSFIAVRGTGRRALASFPTRALRFRFPRLKGDWRCGGRCGPRLPAV
jgi:hypothetical protein